MTMTQPDAAPAGGQRLKGRERPAPDHVPARRATGASDRHPSCCSPRALWGWSPPPLPTDAPLKRHVDRFVSRTGLPVVLYIAAVIAALNLAPLLPRPGELAMDGAAALAAGGWCGLNFWRCRHAHCLVTSTGWIGLSLLAFVEAGLGHSVIGGDEQLVFLGVLMVALLFEGAWYLAHGTNAVSSSTHRVS
jgi:hypothetical protein